MGSAESSHDKEGNVASHEGTAQQVLKDDEDANAALEINDLRVVFSNITGSKKLLELRSILKLPEIKAQIAEGDISVEDLESVWLEACTVKGSCSPLGSGESWGVRTGLSFDGFVHFLRLCEKRVSAPKDLEASAVDTHDGHILVAARHRMMGLVRATITLHHRGGVGGQQGNDNDDAALGDKLHHSMVRASLEHGLAHHTPETLRELMRTGVYKASAEEAKLERQEREASLEAHLSKQQSHDELVRSGILVERTPEQRALDDASVSKGGAEEATERSLPNMDEAVGGQGSQSQPRPVPTPEEEKHLQQYKAAQDHLEQELNDRMDLCELKDKGIYLSKQMAAQQSLHRAMLSDQLNQSLRNRPFVENLMDRGVIEASALKNAFEDLQVRGPVTTPYDVIQWPVVAAALEEGVVKLEKVEEAFAEATACDSASSAEKGSDGGASSPAGMTYEQFDAFLGSVRTMQVEDEPVSLKLWAIMRMRPELDEQLHHEGNKRRNAIMAAELEQGLGKREPLERLANKGIYVDKTPTETGVERAHLTHTLSHGLKHRARLEDLAQKGVYLKGVESGDLEEAHRDARNTLEGMLSRRPDLSTLEEMGYLEADELEEEFLQLVLDHRHEVTTTTSEGTGSIHPDNHGVLCLPPERLSAWPPVRAMVESGAAVEDDVTAALQKAKEASAGGGGEVDFVGFLEFVHNLDLEVDGMEDSATGSSARDMKDPDAKQRHMLRLEKRRERAAQASKEEAATHGTLKEHLVAHLRSRPGRRDPETQRIAKEFHPAEAVALQKNLVRHHLESHLRSLTGGASSGGASKTERAGRVKELEFKLNKRMLMHKLTKRSDRRELRQKGILHTQSALQESLQRKVASDAVKHALEARPSLQEMERSGLYVANGTESPANMEDASTRDIAGSVTNTREIPKGTVPDRHVVEARLESALGNPLRPSKKELLAQGIYLDATPQELRMSHYLAARNLKHGLEGRETIQDLKNKGVYLPEDSNRAAHEKLLVKALLRRKLKHAFSHEELAQLKQKGIYKEAEHDRLEAERALVTRQLARLVSNRPSPDEMEKQHPELLQAGTLALVFEERVMPRAGAEDGGGGKTEGDEHQGPEHVVSFDALMTWPDVKEHIDSEGGDEEKVRSEMAQHFRLCDADSDGFLTFSQFLRWVELCDLNPEDHVQVLDSELETEYYNLLAGHDACGISMEEAEACRLVKRWSTSAGLSEEELKAMWGEGAAEDGKRDLQGFKAFCRSCEDRSCIAHNSRLEELQAKASAAEAEAKQALKNKLAARLSARPDLQELKRTRIYRAGGLDPATQLLERNLISNDLKQQLLARPALEDLEKRGIKPNDSRKAQLAKNSSLLAAALDSTMQHDDARWRVDPSHLGAGSREEVSALLQQGLSKRRSKQELTNKGIYIVDSDASYALLVHKVVETYVSFKASSSDLADSLGATS